MRAAEIAAHLPRGRKSLAGYTACCPSHEDRTPSLSLRDSSDGVVLVHCHAGCSQDAVILALRERGLWPEPYKPATPAEAARLRRYLRDLDDARHWAHAVRLLFEIRLEALPPDACERRLLAWLLIEIRQAGDGAGLVPLFRFWQREAPRVTKGLVHAGRRSDKRIRRRLAAWIVEEARRAA